MGCLHGWLREKGRPTRKPGMQQGHAPPRALPRPCPAKVSRQTPAHGIARIACSWMQAARGVCFPALKPSLLLCPLPLPPPHPHPPTPPHHHFREDLAALPPEADLDAYSAMPVEQFGMALLR